LDYLPDDAYKKKPGKRLTFAEAKIKAGSYCAYQERCQQEVRDKLYEYGLHHDKVEELLSYLISENFINEERFAKAFTGGKFRLKKWGRVKIEHELNKRKISAYCIKKGLEEIDQDEYRELMDSLIESKSKTLPEKNVFKLKNQIASSLIRKGFESSLVWQILNDKIRN
jgi:regulatory protein